MTSTELWTLFEREYLQLVSPFKYLSHRLAETDGSEQQISVKLRVNEEEKAFDGRGNGPIDAFLNAMNLDISIRHYEEHSLSQGSAAVAIAYIEISRPGILSLHGVGIYANIVTASLLAVLSAVNRASI